MKDFKLKMVIISTICLLDVTKADSLCYPTWTTIMPTNYFSLPPYLSLNCLNKIHSLDAISAGEWKLNSETDKIYIYERWVKITETHFVRERKGEMRVNCNFDQAVKMISSYENLKYWMNGVKENILVKRNNSTNWITYNIFSLPWPFENRDIISEYHLNNIKTGIYIQININSINNIIVQKKGITRIDSYYASWHIKRLSEQTVWISFSALSDTPPVVPRFIQDPILENTFIKNLVNLRTFMENSVSANN